MSEPPDALGLSSGKLRHAPLAELLRPQTLAQMVGQSHLIGKNMPLRIAIESGVAHSMLLWGPPGVGKTTLARLMANAFAANFIALSAVLAGVKEVRAAVEQAELTLAQSGRRTVLFVDEAHRFNKAQQDAFLPYVEQGLLTFIGATTENPSFEINAALLSRVAVYVLKPLSSEELECIIERALAAAADPSETLQLETAARQALVAYADGDARRLINLLEVLRTAAHSRGCTQIDNAFLEEVMAANLRRFDKGGDAFYDQISALHKSVRGSHPDAALYWMMRMLDGGADPLYIARRLVRMALEDIGLADPRALEITLNACAAYERLGSPEGELALTNAVLYLAVAAKSNAAYLAHKQAQAFVKQDKSREVPPHLRNAPTKLMRELGYGHAYRYAHDEPEAYAAGENYLPHGMAAPNWYRPVPRGLELRIQEKLTNLKNLDQEAHRLHLHKRNSSPNSS